jgi:hypothetical protein
MPRCSAIAIAVLLLAIPSSSKDKNKASLPAAILRAQYVAVVVDPDAGIPVMSPGENETARSDVKAALEKWDRFKTTLNTGERRFDFGCPQGRETDQANYRWRS